MMRTCENGHATMPDDNDLGLCKECRRGRFVSEQSDIHFEDESATGGKKHRYLICIAILATCACLGLGVLSMMPGAGISKRNFDRIEKGMTLAEVKVILGEPRGVDRKDAIWR